MIVAVPFSGYAKKPASKSAPKVAAKKTAAKAPAWNPVCKKMTPTIWRSNYDGCMKAFQPGITNKQITQQKSEGICQCVANGLVKESKCGDIERFQKDKVFEQDMTNRLAKKCIPQPAAARTSNR